MRFSTKKSMSSNEDIILPFKKEGVDSTQIMDLTGVENPDFDGDFKEVSLLYSSTGRRVYLLGLGEKKHASKLSDAFRSLAHKYGKNWGESIQLDAQNLTSNEVELVALGLKLATYQIAIMKSDSKPILENVAIQFSSDKDIFESVSKGEMTGDTMNRIKELVDSPANRKTPEFLANWAVESGKVHGYETKIWDKKQLTEEGFSAVLAVGQGSVNEPRLIQQTWNPTKSETPDLVLVGKGITFDTGGLSIKPSQNLHYMKSDMGGASAVLGTLELAARLGIQKHIVGVVASAENAVDGESYRPGDVINSYSGKTIEIIDTDAEGRLVLADAISYSVRNLKPKQMIDLATLTGSVVRTLGYSAAGLFTNNKGMVSELERIGHEINEKVWQLPLFREFEEELHSDIADIKNLTMRPIAGGINAAKFLESFTEDHPAWAHVDIAGVAFGDSEYAKMKCASGFGVRLLIEYLKK